MDLPTLDIQGYFDAIIKYSILHYPGLIAGIKTVIGYLIGLSIPFSVLFFIGIIYSVERLKAIRRKEEREIYGKPEAEEGVAAASEKGNPEMAKRWDTVVTHVESPNENDWRQAIIEADIILGDLLVKLGYKGQSIGEQLKRAHKGDFATLDDAWDAHKVRNEIAHAGSDFKMSQLEARRVIGLYRKVFEEFYHI